MFSDVPKLALQDTNISKQCFSYSNSVLNVQISSHPYLQNVTICIIKKNQQNNHHPHTKTNKQNKATKKKPNKNWSLIAWCLQIRPDKKIPSLISLFVIDKD